MGTLLLPVADLLNNVITINNYLRASQTVQLAPFILNDPAYAQLVQKLTNWQSQIWTQYFEGLIDANLIPQPEEIAELYNIGIATQNKIKGILFPSGGPVPGVVSLCDDVSSLIAQGETLVSQLQDIAKSIQGADQKRVDLLQQQADALQSEFNKQEDTLTDDSIGSAIDLVFCAIDVAVAIGSEGDVVQPLVKCVTKIAQDAITELELTDSINDLLKGLEATWALLDQASVDLAQVSMTVNQLNAVVEDTSEALTAIQAIVTDWTQVADTVTESSSQWSDTGNDAMNEWSSRMIKISFTTAAQGIPTTITE